MNLATDDGIDLGWAMPIALPQKQTAQLVGLGGSIA
jgi:hypothetical protein